MANNGAATTAIWVALIGAGATIATSFIRSRDTSATATPVDLSRPVGNLAGAWRIGFSRIVTQPTGETRTSPWREFLSSVSQAGDTVEGTLVSEQPDGAFHCQLQGNVCRGSMRLIEEASEWDNLVLELQSSVGATILGRASVMRSGEMRRYSIFMTRI